MTRATDLAASREGLLKDEDASPGPPHDASSSGSELDLDELQTLEAQPSSSRLRGGWSPTRRKKKGVMKGHPRLPSKRKGGLLRNKTWMLITAILLGGLIGVLGGVFGGMFKKPGLQDGVSPPLYEGSSSINVG